MRITREAKKRSVARTYALRHKRVERRKEPGGEFLGRYFGVGCTQRGRPTEVHRCVAAVLRRICRGLGRARWYTGVSPQRCEEREGQILAPLTDLFLGGVREVSCFSCVDCGPLLSGHCCCRFSRERCRFSPTAVWGTSPLISIHTDSCSCAPARGRIWNILRLCGPPVLVASR